MKLTINSHWLRWIVIIGVGAVGLFFGFVDGNLLPLLALIFALIFLSSALINKMPPTSRVFVRRLGFSTFLVALVVGGFNYVVNPFGLYPPHFFEPLVLTTRDYKMTIYMNYSPPPEAVIMGSSRSFPVDPDQIKRLWHYSTFNFSVPVGTMRDFLALLHYMSEVGKLPDLLIINVAPEIFLWWDDQRYGLEPDAQLWNYVEVQDSLFPLKDSLYRMARLLSRDQIEASVHVLQVTGTNQSRIPKFITEPNGMIRTTGTALSSDDLNPDKVFVGIRRHFGNIFDQYTPASYRLDVLQKILEIAKQEHMLVIGYMPPYHPAMRDALASRTAFTANLNYLTGQLDNLEKEYPFHYLNFIDSPAFSNADDMFYDYIHPTTQASELMMQQLYDQFHSYAQP